MPKIMHKVPPMKLPTDNSSEAETNASTSAATTGRSTYGRSEKSKKSEKFHLPKFSSQYNKNKYRKTNFGPRGAGIMKNPCFKLNESKGRKALQIKSQIPRAILLTPKSSIVAAAAAAAAAPAADTPKDTSKDNIAKTSALVSIDRVPPVSPQEDLATLQYQDTQIFLAFRQRKSISQMDMKHARRNHSALVKHHLQQQDTDDSTGSRHTQSDEDLFEKHITYCDSFFCSGSYSFVGQDKDARRLASMRLFTTMMLNAWRKRRTEVRRLLEEVDELKRLSVRSKNQLHVYNTLFRVEQKRNDHLNCQLKRSLDDINLTKNSCEALTTSLITLKADKALLEQQMHTKEQECEDLNALLVQTKSDLFKAMGHQRELQGNLCLEQRKVHQLESEKTKLINEICELSNEFCEKEMKLTAIIEAQEAELKSLKASLTDSNDKISYLNNSKELIMKNYIIGEEKLKEEIDLLRNEINQLEESLKITMFQKIKTQLMTTFEYRQTVFQVFHCFLYCLVPSTPSPKMHPIYFNICINKALSVMKR